MGFCLFEHADVHGFYFAVNAGYVSDIQETVQGFRIKLTFGDADLLARGSKADIEVTLQKAAKIGVRKVNATILGGKGKRLRPMPMLLNGVDRIMAVRELLPDEFIHDDAEFMTASLVFFEDGTQRMIVERPGIFARLANKAGAVPFLK